MGGYFQYSGGAILNLYLRAKTMIIYDECFKCPFFVKYDVKTKSGHYCTASVDERRLNSCLVISMEIQIDLIMLLIDLTVEENQDD